MAIVIGGHIRSGTTLLQRLCHAHPEMTVTLEFNNFEPVGSATWYYCYRILRRCWAEHKRLPELRPSGNHVLMMTKTFRFNARYLLEICRRQRGRVYVHTIERALKSMFPASKVVGDKMPAYADMLGKLADLDNLLCILIYRDCRDVVSSTLRAVHGAWANNPRANKLNSAAKVARNWVQTMELMEQYRRHIYVLSYESLIRTPRDTLTDLARMLEIDPNGFPMEQIHEQSVGRHRSGLSHEDMSTVLEIAGPTMKRFGYL